jgi:hypothetical protein
MNSIDIQNIEQEEEMIGYEEYFNSYEIGVLLYIYILFI